VTPVLYRSHLTVNDALRIIIDDSSVMVKIVVSHADNSRGIKYNHNMFIVQAT